jgi:hypothetical protein
MVTKVNLANGEIICSGIRYDELRLDLMSIGVDRSQDVARRSARDIGEIRLSISQ